MIGNLYISPESKRWKTSKRLATAMGHFQTGSIPSGHGGRQHAAQVPRLKRSHKKSRQGCLTCKQRRVKVRRFVQLAVPTRNESGGLIGWPVRRKEAVVQELQPPAHCLRICD